MGTITGIPINGTSGVQKFVVAHHLGVAPTNVQLTLQSPTATDFNAVYWWEPNSTNPSTYFDVYVNVLQNSLTSGATVNITWVAYTTK